MSNMFSVKCDLCSTVQTEENASALSGTAITMNGVTRHACGPCMEILRTAFAIGKEGLQEPMKALVKITAERDQLFRLKQANDQVRSGGILSLEEMAQGRQRYMLANPVESTAPRLGGPAPEARPQTPKTSMMGRLLGNKKSPKKDGKR
jgi:hypothetical protein